MAGRMRPKPKPVPRRVAPRPIRHGRQAPGSARRSGWTCRRRSRRSARRGRRHGAKSRSSFSISTKSRIEREASMPGGQKRPENQPRLFVGWPGTLAGHQEVAVLVPFAAGEVIAEDGRSFLRLGLHAEREVGLDQAVQRLRHVRRRLIALDDDTVAIDGADILLVATGSSGRPPSPCRRDGRCRVRP